MSNKGIKLIANEMGTIAHTDLQWKQKSLNDATQKGSRNARIAKEFVYLYQGKL